MAQSSVFLLIDISNSFAKIAFASRIRIARPQRIATEKLTSEYLRRIQKKRKIDMWVVSSVVPKKNRVIRSAAGKTPVLWVNPRLKLCVGNDYPAAKTIARDRIANVATDPAVYGWSALLAVVEVV